MESYEEFIAATFAASNAILLLKTILISGKLPKDRFDEGMDSLLGILSDLKEAVENSEYTAEYVKRHVRRLEALAHAIR